MGRPAIPLKIHQLHGTANRAVAGKPSKAITTAGHAPPMPRGLDAVAKAMWRHVITTRGAWLAESDGPALRSMCETWSLRCTALALLQSGDVSDKIIRVAFIAYQREFNSLAAKFGLSPSDRARLGELSASDIDPAAEFVK